MPTMNVFLCGYRGCGKSTVGRLLAKSLNLSFVDQDLEVCKIFNNNSIADIWKQHGESEWRQAESTVTRQLCQQDGQVVGLGGGALTHPDARAAVENSSNTVRFYLRCDPQELLRRINQDTQTDQSRPDLTDLGGGLAEIEKVLAEREPTYRSVADHEIDVTLLNPSEAADTLRALYF